MGCCQLLSGNQIFGLANAETVFDDLRYDGLLRAGVVQAQDYFCMADRQLPRLDRGLNHGG